MSLILTFFRTGKYVALKIGMAKYSHVEDMEMTFKHTNLDHPGAKHISTKIDSFKFDGPNGTHLCLVLEPLGRSFEDLVEDVSQAA